MAATNGYSEQFILELYRKEHDVENDSLVCCLMKPAFVFDPATDATWADVSADEIAAGNGYLSKTEVLANVAASIVAGVIKIDCDDPAWTAGGGAIASAGGMIVINDSHGSDTVVCNIDFDATYDPATGTTFQVSCTNGLLKGTPQ